ncbi:MAG: glucose-1-phosphate cytidylyltransferase [Lachnospiraceae bacterium]
MKVVILAGGFGTRISEESHLKPKPMIEIGENPILWHIMKSYAAYGFNEFVICCGYKGYVIKEYFANYYFRNSDVTFDYSDANSMHVHSEPQEKWKVTLVDTGLTTMTGGRIRRIQKHVQDEPFMLTYGDGVSDVNLREVLEFHKSHHKIATMTAGRVTQRFGVLDINQDNSITEFREKASADGHMVNIGFMVLDPAIFEYLEGDDTVFEKEPLERLAKEGQLMAYQHNGYWQSMDTQRDKMQLETMWNSGKAPWRVW